MIRILLDLDYLPNSKKNTLLDLMQSFSVKEKSDFVRGLIYLGHITLLQRDLNEIANIISENSINPANKIRVHLTNPSLLSLLGAFKTKISRRNFIYALLYSGFGSFIKFKAVSETKVTKNSEKIERVIFLSGLSNYFERLASVKSSPTSTF